MRVYFQEYSSEKGEFIRIGVVYGVGTLNTKIPSNVGRLKGAKYKITTHWISQKGFKQLSALDTFIQRPLPSLDLGKEVSCGKQATRLTRKNLK